MVCMNAHRILLLAVLPALLLSQTAVADPIRMIMVGDSITVGRSSTPGATGYVDDLTAQLGADYEVVNAGLGGSSAVLWDPGRPCFFLCPDAPNPTDSFYDLVLAPELPADIVSIMLGTNDALGFWIGAPATEEIYRNALTALIDETLEFGANTILLATPPPFPGDRPEGNALLRDYRAVVIDLCSTLEGVVCGPDINSLLDAEAHFNGDNIHPNSLGHAAIADAFYDSVLSIPEPGTGVFVTFGVAVLTLKRRRSRLRSRPLSRQPTRSEHRRTD
jgi:lysophospholipase L1-like esterase